MTTIAGRTAGLLTAVLSLGLLAAGPSSAADPVPAATTASTSTTAGSPRYVVEPFRLRPDDDPRLVRAWHLWERADLTDYATKVDRSCFCPPSRPILTEVVGRRVVSKTYLGGERQLRGHGYEMDQLFRLLRQAYARADSVRVSYGARGVPRSIAVDRDRLIADDEQYLSVRVRG